jgi:hypothetical protein
LTPVSLAYINEESGCGEDGFGLFENILFAGSAVLQAGFSFDGLERSVQDGASGGGR